MEAEYDVSRIAGSLKSGEYIGRKRAGFFLFGLCLALALFAAALVGIILGFCAVIVVEPVFALLLIVDGGASVALGASCFRYLRRRRSIARDFEKCKGTLVRADAQAAATDAGGASRRKPSKSLRLRFKIEGKKYNKSGFIDCKLFAQCVRRQKVNILFSPEYGEVFILKEGLYEI